MIETDCLLHSTWIPINFHSYIISHVISNLINKFESRCTAIWESLKKIWICQKFCTLNHDSFSVSATCSNNMTQFDNKISKTCINATAEMFWHAEEII